MQSSLPRPQKSLRIQLNIHPGLYQPYQQLQSGEGRGERRSKESISPAWALSKYMVSLLGAILSSAGSRTSIYSKVHLPDVWRHQPWCSLPGIPCSFMLQIWRLTNSPGKQGCPMHRPPDTPPSHLPETKLLSLVLFHKISCSRVTSVGSLGSATLHQDSIQETKQAEEA